VEPQDPQASERRQGKKKVHSLIDKVYRRQNLARAWEQGQKNRGSAGLDEVRMAPCETRTADDLARLHRQRRDGTYQPPPVTRVESPKSAGGVRKLGIPAVRDRVGQQALVQRMEASFEPKVLDSSFTASRAGGTQGSRVLGIACRPPSAAAGPTCRTCRPSLGRSR
jgi:retron-type reverse transcriptase